MAIAQHILVVSLLFLVQRKKSKKKKKKKKKKDQQGNPSAFSKQDAGKNRSYFFFFFFFCAFIFFCFASPFLCLSRSAREICFCLSTFGSRKLPLNTILSVSFCYIPIEKKTYCVFFVCKKKHTTLIFFHLVLDKRDFYIKLFSHKESTL